MIKHGWRAAWPLLALCAPSAWVHAACTLKASELPVTMSGLRPLVPAKINGVPLYLIVDSGAFMSVLASPSAARLHLMLQSTPLQLSGVADSVPAAMTTVRQLTLADATLPDVRFLVGGSDPGGGAAGLLGENVLRLADVEYDLGNGVIRLMHPQDCGSSPLAYWARTVPYSVIDITPVTDIINLRGRRRGVVATPFVEAFVGTAYLNGAKMRVLFDTGSGNSLLTLRAAARAGVKPDSAGVVRAGGSIGIGAGAVPLWIGPFESFRIGAEQTLHTRLRFGEVHIGDADMLLGADFFLSHRIYVANGQHKLYFTYNGGPVFNLEAGAVASGQSNADTAEPTDAAGFSRRGIAFAARHEFQRAIADLTRACELDPKRPEYFYERGLAYLDDKQPHLALADFDQVLRLRPDYTGALLARAELHLSDGDLAAAGADLDGAARVAPTQSEVRLLIAADFVKAEQFGAAVAQYDLWIAAHPNDARLALALNGRCWARGLGGFELKQARGDCNRALRLDAHSATTLVSRGLLRLRDGKFADSLADYEAALRQEPQLAWALYGRGVDEVRLGRAAAAQADIAAALALEPGIAELARKCGIAP